jgi:hypothetical protein
MPTIHSDLCYFFTHIKNEALRKNNYNWKLSNKRFKKHDFISMVARQSKKPSDAKKIRNGV